MTKSVDCDNCVKCFEGKTLFGLPVNSYKMIVCPDCGNKRCPKASDCQLACSNSNRPGQAGSVYREPAQDESKRGEL